MELRGRRRCSDCGHTWSYFDTGSVACPECGGLRNVAVDDEPTLHTDGAEPFDLSAARARLGDAPLREVAPVALEAAREYRRDRGFVAAGELQPLDDVVVAAAEIDHLAGRLRREMQPDDDAEAYFLDLLAGAEDGGRPATVPEACRGVRGLAIAETVEAYRRDLRAWLDANPDPAARSVLDALRAHERRVAALDGEVSPETATSLLEAARELGTYLRTRDESSLAAAEDRLSRLG